MAPFLQSMVFCLTFAVRYIIDEGYNIFRFLFVTVSSGVVWVT